MSENKVTIIGGFGFIGRNLMEFFLEKNFHIKIIGNNSNNHHFENDKIETFKINVSNTEELVSVMDHSETVVWLVSSLVPGLNEGGLIKDFETNIAPVINFLEKAKTNQFLKKFIFLSSGGTIYGNKNLGETTDETQEKYPISEYGLSKLVTETYINYITHQSSFESFILRPSNVYGKYQNLQKPQGIIGYAFKSIIEKNSIDLYNYGNAIRDFVHVSDLCEAVYKCFMTEYHPGESHTYNIGSGTPYSINQIIQKINLVSGEEVATIPKPARSFDCEYSVLNHQKITNELNWFPQKNIEDGLLEVWEWIKARN